MPSKSPLKVRDREKRFRQFTGNLKTTKKSPKNSILTKGIMGVMREEQGIVAPKPIKAKHKAPRAKDPGRKLTGNEFAAVAARYSK